MQNSDRFYVSTQEQFTSTASDRINLSIARPEINRYHPSLAGKTDLYHNFPLSLDKEIIHGGSWAQRISDGANWFEAPGMINGTPGMYQIGINNGGTVFHRAFIP